MDAAERNALHVSAFGRHGAHGWRESDFKSAISDPSFHIRSSTSGYAIARVVLDEAELLLIGALPRHRRQGAATSLLQSLEADLARAGARRLMLEVSASNRAAIHFYLARGFAEVGTRPGYYGRGESTGHAALLFEKPLKT